MSDVVKLSADFVAELIKACLENTKILGICREHLKYQYLETESQKKVLKYIYDFSSVSFGAAPTVGMIAQAHSTEKDVLNLLGTVKKVQLIRGMEDNLLASFETFIKNRRFIVLHDKLADLYNEGKKDEAIAYMAEESDAIHKFTVKQQYYTTIFGDFDKRQEKRERTTKDDVIKDKCPYGIHELDDDTFGGGAKGTSACFLARSGVGKTTLGRWIGLSNARIGKRVVHFFGEGIKQEHEEGYDAAWTGATIREVEFGEIPEKLLASIKTAHRNILAGGGEIIIICSESFDAMSIDDCYETLKDIEANIGKVDVAIFDYLEIFTSKGRYGNAESAERKRREDVANKITNIATELKLFSVTFTQANDIKFEKWNNPDYKLTRSDISEFKGAIKPFSVFITLNQTEDEYENQIIRLHYDKFRKSKKGKTIRIYQSLENGRFYDSKKTLGTFYSKV